MTRPTILSLSVAVTASLNIAAAQGAAPVEPGGVKLTPREIRAGATTYRADLGRIDLPENRSDPKSRRISVAFVRLRSTAKAPGAPLFYLAGGPGNPATPAARGEHWRPVLATGDVVLVDIRGVGQSIPRLVWRGDAMRPELLFRDAAEATAHMVEMAKQARAHFAGQGVDLRGYTTVETARDFDAIRKALGYGKINLLGHSYGTHLGQEIVRQLGAGVVSRFVSVGTAGTGDMQKLPSESDRSLRDLAAVVAADKDIGKAYPDFAGSVRKVMDRLAERPLDVTVRGPSGPVEVRVGRHGLQLILLADLGDTNDLPVFPALLFAIEKGDPSILRWFVQKRYSQFLTLPVLTFVNRGASGASAARWKRIHDEAKAATFGKVRTLFSPEIDAALGTPDLGDEFRRPVRSEVPTLFVSGTLDAHTPPWQAEEVRRGFPNSGHLIVENGGHEDLLPNPEVFRRVLAFLRGAAPKDERLQGKPLRFVPLQGRDPSRTHPAVEAARR